MDASDTSHWYLSHENVRSLWAVVILKSWGSQSDPFHFYIVPRPFNYIRIYNYKKKCERVTLHGNRCRSFEVIIKKNCM